MDTIEMFLRDHARAHASGVGEPEGGIAIGDVATAGLSDNEIRIRPGDGLNSLAWIIWHIARTEDMAVNFLVAGRPQVLGGDGWAERLNIGRVDMAAGMTEDEVADFSTNVNIAALREYRNAVGNRTREVVSAMCPEDFDKVIDTELITRAYEQGAILQAAGWLEGFVNGKTYAFILGHAATGHNFMHLGEAFCLRSMIGHRVPV